jgi:sugar phosphate isomerase/epimerase
MDRRHFVGSLGAAALAPGLLRAWPRPAAADLDKVGLQLYTVRNQMEASVEKTLYDVARIGYKEVEFAGYFGRPPRAIKQLLDRNDLKSPSAHVPITSLSSGWYRTLTEASQMDQKWLVIAWLAEEDRNSLDAIKRTAELFNKAGEDAKTFKIRLAYHNHDFEFQEVEGRRIFDVLLEETDPEYVDFEMDLYWITKGGADPFAYFERWPERFPLVHVKDSGPAPERRMMDVGKGEIDFARIFAERKLAGMKHFFVEHDNPADPMASIQTSFRYLSHLEFDDSR